MWNPYRNWANVYIGDIERHDANAKHMLSQDGSLHSSLFDLPCFVQSESGAAITLKCEINRLLYQSWPRNNMFSFPKTETVSPPLLSLHNTYQETTIKIWRELNSAINKTVHTISSSRARLVSFRVWVSPLVAYARDVSLISIFEHPFTISIFEKNSHTSSQSIFLPGYQSAHAASSCVTLSICMYTIKHRLLPSFFLTITTGEA